MINDNTNKKSRRKNTIRKTNSGIKYDVTRVRREINWDSEDGFIAINKKSRIVLFVDIAGRKNSIIIDNVVGLRMYDKSPVNKGKKSN